MKWRFVKCLFYECQVLHSIKKRCYNSKVKVTVHENQLLTINFLFQIPFPT